MRVIQYLVDAFAERLFCGNQAAVCATDAALPDDLMQKVARENNFSETAFLVPADDEGDDRDGCEARYSLRWFTPGGEIDLCGHATLAATFVVDRFLRPGCGRVAFDTASGELRASCEGGLVVMDMPAYAPKPVAVTDDMERVYGVRPLEAWLARDLVCVLPDEGAVRSARPDVEALLRLPGLTQAITARADAGSGFDCVSRCFAPELDVYEDAVTGSTHCAIAPIWAQKLRKDEILAFQASERTGILRCCVEGDRVKVAGPAVLYVVAELSL